MSLTAAFFARKPNVPDSGAVHEDPPREPSELWSINHDEHPASRSVGRPSSRGAAVEEHGRGSSNGVWTIQNSLVRDELRPCQTRPGLSAGSRGQPTLLLDKPFPARYAVSHVFGTGAQAEVMIICIPNPLCPFRRNRLRIPPRPSPKRHHRSCRPLHMFCRRLVPTEDAPPTHWSIWCSSASQQGITLEQETCEFRPAFPTAWKFHTRFRRRDSTNNPTSPAHEIKSTCTNLKRRENYTSKSK